MDQTPGILAVCRELLLDTTIELLARGADSDGIRRDAPIRDAAILAAEAQLCEAVDAEAARRRRASQRRDITAAADPWRGRTAGARVVFGAPSLTLAPI